MICILFFEFWRTIISSLTEGLPRIQFWYSWIFILFLLINLPCYSCGKYICNTNIFGVICMENVINLCTARHLSLRLKLYSSAFYAALTQGVKWVFHFSILVALYRLIILLSLPSHTLSLTVFRLFSHITHTDYHYYSTNELSSWNINFLRNRHSRAFCSNTRPHFSASKKSKFTTTFFLLTFTTLCVYVCLSVSVYVYVSLFLSLCISVSVSLSLFILCMFLPLCLNHTILAMYFLHSKLPF